MTPARVVVPRARLVMVSARARDGRSIYRHMINDLSRSVVSRSYIVKTRSQHMNWNKQRVVRNRDIVRNRVGIRFRGAARPGARRHNRRSNGCCDGCSSVQVSLVSCGVNVAWARSLGDAVDWVHMPFLGAPQRCVALVMNTRRSARRVGVTSCAGYSC